MSCASRAPCASSIRPWTPPTSISATMQGSFRSTIAPTRCHTSRPSSNAVIPIRGARLAAGLVSSSPPSGLINTFELLTRLSERINHGFGYRRREAKGIEQPVETLRLGHGSCRDFAVLMIDAARSLGFAARFRVRVSRHAARRSGRAAEQLGSRVNSMHGRKSICRAPAGLISTPRAAASAISHWSPLRSCADPYHATPLHGTFIGFPSDHLGMEVQVSVTSCTPDALWATPQLSTYPQLGQSH